MQKFTVDENPQPNSELSNFCIGKDQTIIGCECSGVFLDYLVN